MKKIIIKDEFPHDWVTREAGEKLRLKILDGLKQKFSVEVDFAGMTIASVSFFDEGFAKLKLEKGITTDNVLITNLNKWDEQVLKLVGDQRGIHFKTSQGPKKSHPWRICPTGEHFVKGHDKKTKTGKVGHWDSFCRKNPSGKEIYTADEIHEISKHFSNSSLQYPKPFKISKWNSYDLLIAGWTQFWNETFNPTDRLSPNYVKALIASESSFDPKTKTANKSVGNAQGLVQITQETSRLLSHKEGELKDHYFELSKDEIFDPDVNICAAIRWLFRKREIAQSKLKRIPTWYEVLLEYKGVLQKENPTANKIRKILTEKISELEEMQ